MTTVFPNNNLPTAAQPWGREIQKQLSNVIASANSERINNTARDNQINSSVLALNGTIQGLIGLGATGSGYTINADNINGGTITGTTLQTSATGQRVVVSNLDQIKFYDSTGTLSGTMEGTAAIGESALSIYSKSVLNTAIGAPGSIFVMNDNGFSLNVSSPVEELGGVFLIDDTGEAVLASDTSIRLTSGSINLNGFIIDANGNFDLGDISVSSIESSGQIDSDGNIFGAALIAKNGGSVSGGAVYTTGEIDAGGNVFGANITAKNNGGVFCGYVSASGTIQTTGSFAANGALTIGGNVRANGVTSTGFLQAENHAGGGTTGASINNNGTIIRTSSSERYKQDIQGLSVDYDDLLSLKPKRFRLKEEVAESEDARYYAGFIAEEIDQTSLKDFVAYRTMEDGSVVPDGVYYGELTAALLEAIKYQDTLIKSLTDRIETLEKGA